MAISPATFIANLQKSKSCSEATISALAQDLKSLVRLAKNRDLHTFDIREIRYFVAEEHRRGLAPSSLRRLLSSWRKFFEYLVEERVIEHNPAMGVRAPRAPRRLAKALSPDEASRLLNNTDKSDFAIRDIAMFETAYSSALRVSELVGLDFEDIDLESMTVNIRHGKGNRQRIVPLGAKAITSLISWFKIRAKYNDSKNGAIFISRSGKRLTTRSVQLRIKALAQKAGLTGDISPHILRHSCASHLLQSSGDLRGVQEMLGHADISSTQIYTHLDFQALAKVYDATHPRANIKANNEK